jgi:predicted nucleic acid-binding protein
MIVVDAALIVDALTDDGPVGDAAQAELAADLYWAAPEHLRVEATSAIRGRWLAGKLSDERADGAARTLNRLTVRYAAWDEVADRVWELRRNHTPYDAAYLALAEVRGCCLVTTDGKLRDCPGRRCEVRVVLPGRHRA